MSRGKQHKFLTIGQADNVIEPGKALFSNLKGEWSSKFAFDNDNPIVLELGCGRGEYCIGLASVFPDQNFIGLDIKGDRLFRGSQNAYNLELKNVLFLRAPAFCLPDFFVDQQIDQIWLTFPDPQSRPRDQKHRLTHPDFLQIYKKILAPNGLVHLKTDSQLLYDYTLETIKNMGLQIDFQTQDLYQLPFDPILHGIQTCFEKKYLQKNVSIKYLRFKF